MSKLNDPCFSHLKWLLGWVFFFASYFLTEFLIPAEKCHVIYSPLDDLIPFCEYFVIPYVLWYVLIVGSLGYFLFYNIGSFVKLQKYFILTQAIAVIAYIIYPSCQNLRPESFANDNLFTALVGLLYSADTNTGVCPSLHCIYSIGIASVWLKEHGVSKGFKMFIVALAVLICMSTAFIKQHSVIDFVAAIPVCILAEFLVFRKEWRRCRTN